MADLARLRSVLDEGVPAKALDRNLLIATWNVRAFGDLTEEWESTEEDTPKRDLNSLTGFAPQKLPGAHSCAPFVPALFRPQVAVDAETLAHHRAEQLATKTGAA